MNLKVFHYQGMPIILCSKRSLCLLRLLFNCAGLIAGNTYKHPNKAATKFLSIIT